MGVARTYMHSSACYERPDSALSQSTTRAASPLTSSSDEEVAAVMASVMASSAPAMKHAQQERTMSELALVKLFRSKVAQQQMPLAAPPSGLDATASEEAQIEQRALRTRSCPRTAPLAQHPQG